ncbi:EAL domain-containing protein [Martelella radicis]|uniref:EAL domain-containing protein (Putative c-di-GMP-specific phosphodiesterase class I)/CheY-like chemotaxis protein n=1 Tax=Martelella radicis TaxID=1397476 RepID=A0A7W6KIZ6_9HYPH|nr:EAL domain-containing protein [Martelella radicis]MBB4121875.1 EAL domain-containing protein (putative c-di-GMP-specific phosphodiesterase class I)/CheY-like chemotaxis protein [Martelella radicis]
MNDDLELELYDDGPADDASVSARPWKILVVDDNPDVHAATEYALKGVVIFGRPLETVCAHSASEAIAKVGEHDDIAVSMIDVVMEADDAGLSLVKALRDMGFSDMRVVLRTGYPGYAPELSVVTDYEIDGYHTKDELSRTRLISLLTTSIRAYDGIRAMSRSREGLELIVKSARQLFRRSNLEMFAEGVLIQIAALIGVEPNGLVCARDRKTGAMRVVAGIGRFSSLGLKPLPDVGDEMKALFANAQESEDPVFAENYLGLYVDNGDDGHLFAALETDRPVGHPELDLLRLFSSNIAVGFRNLTLIEALDRLAFRDAFLDLPNLNSFEHALGAALDGSRVGYIVKVYVCDYQNMVASFGSPVANKVMQEAYARLSHLCQGKCTIALIAEGAFGIVDPECQLSTRSLSRVLDQVYLIDGIELAPRPTSVMIPMDDLPEDRSRAISVATAALIHIRSVEDGAHVVYGKAERRAWERRNMLQDALKASVETGRGFSLMLQPKVELESGRMYGAEALLRWTLDEEAISPAEFIPIAERTGMTRALTAFVLRQVADWSQLYANADGTPLPIAVNLSMADLNVPGFAMWLCRRVDALGLDRHMLEFEVTEAIAMHGRIAIRQVELLFRRGFRISLDDFGTGYSSFGHLNALPISTVKVDRSFVRDLTGETAGRSLCSVIIAMAEKLGVECIAEGIETEEQRQALLKTGCGRGQGFLFGRPMSMDRFSQRFGLIARSGGG